MWTRQGADPVPFQAAGPDLGHLCLPPALLGHLPSTKERQPGSQRQEQRAEVEASAVETEGERQTWVGAQRKAGREAAVLM